MDQPFVFITEYRGAPTLRVSFRKNSKRWAGQTKNYPLTRKGCVAAGTDVILSGADGCMFSSSVDFPREYKPRCRLPVRLLIKYGARLAALERDKLCRQVVAMMLDHCQQFEFQVKLTPGQKQVFAVIAKELGS